MKTTSKFYFIIKLSILVFIGILVFSTLMQFKAGPKVELYTFKIENGFGYNILVNNKIYIHQEIIPAVINNQHFISRHDAQITGTLVIEKLKTGKVPALSINELDSLKIRFNK
jgi:hypothetical protein